MKIVEILIKSALAAVICYGLARLIGMDFCRTWGEVGALFAGFAVGNSIYELIKK